MASSGAFETNAIGGLGASPNRVRFQWSLASQNEDGNYSVINWNVRGVGGSGGYWTTNFGTNTHVNGAHVQGTGQFNMYNGSVFGSGTRTIGHNSSGSKSFGASVSAKIYYNSWNSNGSGSWALPGLYQDINFHSISINTVTDIGFRVYAHVNRTSNLFQLSINGGGWVSYQSGGGWGSYTVQVGGSNTNALRSGETYSVRVRVRRASNGRLKESGTYYVTTAPQSKFFDIGDF